MLTDRYSDALVYAALTHRGQVRKGTATPYLSHLLAVSSLVMEHEGGEDEAIGGLLHDVIEDVGPAEAPIIAARFGDAVLQIVLGCTDAAVFPKPPWRERKERYLAHLDSAPPSVLLVSCCDKLHNATAILNDLDRIGPGVFERFTAGRDGTLWYYRSLADVFVRLGTLPASRLARAVEQIERKAAA
jgi:(p)ppGpp synthase/HD superfamily hydrolase